MTYMTNISIGSPPLLWSNIAESFEKINSNFSELEFILDTSSLQSFNIQGSVYSSNGTLLVDSINAKIVGPIESNVTGNVIGDLIGNVTGNVAGDITGSLFSNDSTLLVDSTEGKIVGPLSSSDGLNSVITDITQGITIASTVLIDVQGVAGAEIKIGDGNSGDVYLGNGSNDILINSGSSIEGSLKYHPSTDDDWTSPAPSTVGEAIDRLAVIVKILNGVGA